MKTSPNNKAPSGEVPSFWTFFQIFVREHLNGGLVLKPHHKYICDKLEQAYRGTLGKKYIVINMPPRQGKTMILRALVAWGLGVAGDGRWIYTSYSDANCTEFMNDMVKIFEDNGHQCGTPWYATVFPWSKRGKIASTDRFSTNAGGWLFGEGVGGALTGKGAGLKRKGGMGAVGGGMVLIDDAAKPQESLSQLVAQKITKWFTQTIWSRSNATATPVVIVAQRLSPEDLPAHVLREFSSVEHIVFPAMAKDGEADEYSTIPESVSTEQLQELRRIDPETYYAQYQQEPRIVGGNLIKVAGFQPYTEDPNTLDFQYKIITTDAAFTKQQSSDYTVMQCWGKLGTKVYLIDQRRGKWESPDFVANLTEFYAEHNLAGQPVRHITMEKTLGTLNFLQTCQRLGLPVKEIARPKGKSERVQDILTFIANGQVYVPKNAWWYKDWELEHANFRKDMGHKHDDQVDCTADAVTEMLAVEPTVWDHMGEPQKSPLLQRMMESLRERFGR